MGFGQGGELTEKVSRNPYSLVLVDEMEKAAPEVLNIFLQIMDEGILTDGEGNKVDFLHTVIVFTSNVGAQLIRKGMVGFEVNPFAKNHQNAEGHDVLKQRLTEELKNSFKPEFLNRLDKIVIFRKLSANDVQKIVRIQLALVSRRFLEKGIRLKFALAAVAWLSQEGFSEEYGVRFLKRTIEEKVTDILADHLLSNRLVEGAKVKVTALKKGLQFDFSPPPSRKQKTAKG